MSTKDQNRKNKAAQRKREAEQRIKRVEVKAHEDDVQDVRDYADVKLSQRGLT